MTGKVVVYDDNSRHRRYLLCNEGVACDSLTDFDEILDQTNIDYVVDGGQPSRCGCKMILLLSSLFRVLHEPRIPIVLYTRLVQDRDIKVSISHILTYTEEDC
ncbi:hypothetical protein THRCLA_23234 [Thraustotheca clavata]|uniref:Uncharacterized protein n=1 Tax=Thraustotheca clavata TaxID=74557 RepID=A0A1V9Y901_9STRA|nr:hypothetical protein THRCLA_23234 [Thraustotheca clavata]